MRNLLVILALASFAASGAEVAGVRLDDKAQVESRDLVLNGAGLRKRVVFNVYVIGLYLPEKKTDTAAVLQLAGPKRAAIHMLRDVGAEQFTDALVEGLRENHSEGDYKALEPRVKELAGIFAATAAAKRPSPPFVVTNVNPLGSQHVNIFIHDFKQNFVGLRIGRAVGVWPGHLGNLCKVPSRPGNVVGMRKRLNLRNDL